MNAMLAAPSAGSGAYLSLVAGLAFIAPAAAQDYPTGRSS